MAHSDYGWTCGCANCEILENTCHTWALLWWFTTKRCYTKCMYLYWIQTSMYTSRYSPADVQPRRIRICVCVCVCEVMRD